MVEAIQLVNVTNTFFIALTISWMVLFQKKYDSFKDDKCLLFVSIVNVVMTLINLLVTTLWM